MGRKSKAELEKLKKMDEVVKARKDAENAPIETALLIRKKPGTGWTFVELQFQGDKVLKETTKECTDKTHAIETYKIAFVQRFINGQ